MFQETTTGNLFQLPEVRRDCGLSDGVLASLEATPEEWMGQAVQELAGCVAQGVPFTVDDLRARGVSDPDKPQRWGSLMAYGVTRGWVRMVGAEPKDRPRRDPALVRVYMPGPNPPKMTASAA